VIIDEAVELLKTYSTEESGGLCQRRALDHRRQGAHLNIPGDEWSVAPRSARRTMFEVTGRPLLSTGSQSQRVRWRPRRKARTTSRHRLGSRAHG